MILLTTKSPYIEGLATVVCAVASFWIIQDFPDKAKFLSEPESGLVYYYCIDFNELTGFLRSVCNSSSPGRHAV
jgi:hypothetical protein